MRQMGITAGLSSTGASIKAMPAELLDEVASFLDTRSDLLSFALTCRALKQIVIPRHSEYRFVRCHYRYLDVWRHFIQRPDLARHVRTLEVVDAEDGPTGPPQIPSVALCSDRPFAFQLSQFTIHDALTELKKALSSMKNLQSFHFQTMASRHDVFDGSVDDEAAVWDTVSKLPSVQDIRRVHSMDPKARAQSLSVPAMPELSTWRMTDLKSFALCDVMRPQTCHDTINHFIPAVLQSSSSLEKLNLAIITHPIHLSMASLFETRSFPMLRDLKLNIRRNIHLNREAYSLLLERTPSIEHFASWDMTLRPLRSGSLPALKSLSLGTGPDRDAVSDLLSDSSLAPRKMEKLCGIHLSTFYVGVLRTLDPHALRRLELNYFESFDVLKDAVALFPQLMWLRIPARDYTYDWSGATRQPLHTAQWGELLYLLPELEVLHGVSLFKDPFGTSVADNDDRARELAMICPKVYRTEHWDLDKTKAIILDRSGGDVTWRVETVTAHTWYS
ncbi:hypothetical protein EWM64_g2000 [Hericium alpestre]|uniref:F-box domain-containing protein n=1 Tax=Hericium alpestre TaxID=135208 RepID=A0A4Z0A6A8_9AGAM|nr:hypothetical protein EWM64_g2000 [Hericium alpestre]